MLKATLLVTISRDLISDNGKNLHKTLPKLHLYGFIF